MKKDPGKALVASLCILAGTATLLFLWQLLTHSAGASRADKWVGLLALACIVAPWALLVVYSMAPGSFQPRLFARTFFMNVAAWTTALLIYGAAGGHGATDPGAYYLRYSLGLILSCFAFGTIQILGWTSSILHAEQVRAFRLVLVFPALLALASSHLFFHLPPSAISNFQKLDKAMGGNFFIVAFMCYQFGPAAILTALILGHYLKTGLRNASETRLGRKSRPGHPLTSESRQALNSPTVPPKNRKGNAMQRIAPG